MDDYTDKELADDPHPIDPPRYDSEDPSDEFPDEANNWDYFCETFAFALIEMSEKYASRRKEKGDSWKGMSSNELRQLFDQEVEEYTAANADSQHEMNELIDILNVGFMLYTSLNDEIFQAAKGSETPEPS